MVGLAWLEYPLRATPLDPDESEGLTPTNLFSKCTLIKLLVLLSHLRKDHKIKLSFNRGNNIEN